MSDVPLDLDAITARAEAASPGPWCIEEDGRAWSIEFNTPGGNQTWSLATLAWAKPDAEFIAHARTDIPALLAEVSRLRGQVRELEDALEDGQRLRDQLAEAQRKLDLPCGSCHPCENYAGSKERNDSLMESLVRVEERADRAEGVVARITELPTLDEIEDGWRYNDLFRMGYAKALEDVRAVLAVPTNTPAPDAEEQT